MDPIPMLQYYLLFKNMILKPKVAPAAFFNHYFTFFQSGNRDNSNLGGEGMKDSTHQEQRNCAQGSDTMPSGQEEKNIYQKNKLDQCQEELKYLTLENSNLIKALRDERKRSASLQSQLEENKHLNSSNENSQKCYRRLPHQTNFYTFEDCLKENNRLRAEIQDKGDRIHNLCVLYMRLKGSKDALKKTLEFKEAEFTEATMDLVEKLAESRDEINFIADARYHTMKDYRSATTIRVVQQNGQLTLENSKLRLKISHLKQQLIDIENENTIVDVNTQKRRVRTVLSRGSCSTRSLSSQPLSRIPYSGKTISASASGARKQKFNGNDQCASCKKEKSIDNIRADRSAEVDDLLAWKVKKNANASSAKKKYRDTWSGGDAKNLKSCERKYTLAKKPNQRSLFSHHHNPGNIFETNAKESLILQATSAPSHHSMKLDTKGNNSYYSESASESSAEETGAMNAEFGNKYSKHLVLKQSSEESLLSEQYSIRGSKSAPEIMERSQYEATAEGDLCY